MTAWRHRAPALALGVVLCVAVAHRASGTPAPAPFAFARDTFAFANETIWEYDVDDATGRTEWRRREPVPDFALHCGPMARAARQFYLHTRFDPASPAPDPDRLAALVAAVLARDPRALVPAADPIVVPGYPGLRALSAAHETLVKDALGSTWRSYFQRGNWRMIFPFPPGQQRAEAMKLRDALRRGETPILHVLRFPELTLNHMVLVFAASETPEELRFEVYDPNDAAAAIVMRWDRGARTFVYPRTVYFGGGPVKAYAIWDGPIS